MIYFHVFCMNISETLWRPNDKIEGWIAEHCSTTCNSDKHNLTFTTACTALSHFSLLIKKT